MTRNYFTMRQLLISLIVLVFCSVFLCFCTSHSEKKYAGVYQEKIIFPFQDEHVHGPTIVELPNGDLLSAWFQGSGERWADDVRIMGSRLKNGDASWSAPFLMADTPGFPDINPMMFMDNEERLWLCWYPVIANLWETSIPKYRISESYDSDGAPKWNWQDIILVKPGDKAERGIQPEDKFVADCQNQLRDYENYIRKSLMQQFPEEEREELMQQWKNYKQKIDSLASGRNMVRKGRIPNDSGYASTRLGYPLSRRIGWQTKNKPVIIGDRIIIPLYSDGFDCSLFAFTDDLGKNWQFSNPVLGGIGIQPAIAICKDGSLVAYLRDNGPAPYRMQRTESGDGGASWSIAKDTDLKNPGAGFDMTTLSSGEWLMIFNDLEEGRYNLTAALSDDDGKSWKWKRVIEHDDNGKEATTYHYPAVIQGKDEYIHIAYSYHKYDNPRKTIKYTRFSVEWVKSDPDIDR